MVGVAPNIPSVVTQDFFEAVSVYCQDGWW